MAAYLDKNVKGFGLRLGFKLRELRLKKGLSQTDLAKKAKIARTTLTMIEGGRKNTTIFIFAKIAKVLNFSMDNFIKNILEN